MSAPHVLLVDDDPDIRHLGRLALGLGGFAVSVAQNGAEAFEQAEAQLPDAILLDAKLQEGEGLALLPGLRRRAPGVAVALLTASRDPELAAEARAAGVAVIIHKPFDPQTLHEQVRALL